MQDGHAVRGRHFNMTNVKIFSRLSEPEQEPPGATDFARRRSHPGTGAMIFIQSHQI